MKEKIERTYLCRHENSLSKTYLAVLRQINLPLWPLLTSDRFGLILPDSRISSRRSGP